MNTPTASPMKMASRLGRLSLLASSPRIFPTLLMALASPTIVSLSPTCSLRSGEASRSIPALLTRVMFIPYRLRRRSEPSFTPLIRLRVTFVFLFSEKGGGLLYIRSCRHDQQLVSFQQPGFGGRYAHFPVSPYAGDDEMPVGHVHGLFYAFPEDGRIAYEEFCHIGLHGVLFGTCFFPF